MEDCALIGDIRTAALIGRDGSVYWLYLPRFDAGACFARLPGDDPMAAGRSPRRRRLLTEEYDPMARRQLGNFAQAFSHVPLVNTPRNLLAGGGPAQQRHME